MRIVKQINFHASFLPWFPLSIFYRSSRRERSCGSLGHCPRHHLRGRVRVNVCDGQGTGGAITAEMKVFIS